MFNTSIMAMNIVQKVSSDIHASSVTDESFKEAMSCFACGVTIVTTIDDNGKKWGFTASAFSSLSLTPPMVLVCLNVEADCYDAFCKTSQFGVNIINPKYEQLALKFAKKGIDKFSDEEFVEGESGVPILKDVLVSLECKKNEVFPGGDHIIITGVVNHVKIKPCEASVWYNNKFHALTS